MAWTVLADAERANLAGTAIDVLATLAARRLSALSAAKLAVSARRIGKAGAVDACAAAGAFVVGTALTRQPAIVGVGAAVLGGGAAGDARSLDALPTDGRAVGIAAAFRLLADAIRVAHFAARALIVAAAFSTIVIWGAVIATALVLDAVGGRTANTINIADCGAAFIFGIGVAICG